MSRMVVTAGWLEELRRSGAEIRLLRDALVTPSARDWLKEHHLPVTWEDAAPKVRSGGLAAVLELALPELRPLRAMLERMGVLGEIIEPIGGRSGLAAATRRLCGRITRREAAKGVVFAHDGALPVCIANKHAGIRAALGASLPAVDEACRELGVNVLVIEYPSQTAYQVRQMLQRLISGPTAAKPEMAATLEAIEQSGGKADW